MSFRYRTYIGPYVQCVGDTNHFTISESINQRLASPIGAIDGAHHIHIWLPNIDYPHRALRLENLTFSLTDITPETIETETYWFQHEFTHELALMRERYYSEMRFGWGIVQDIN